MDHLRVSLVQADLKWENIDANLASFSEKIANLKEPTDLIVLPEMFTTGFSMDSEKLAETMEGSGVTWMAKTAAEKNTVVTGSLIIEEQGNYYNRLIWMRPDRTFEQYDKRHLFRFAGENEHFSAGQDKLIVELNGWRICPLICFDLRFPVWSLQ